MEIRTLKVNEIDPAVYNPRKDLQPGDPEYDKLKKSILEFDMVEPLVWNKRTSNLVGGHQRLKVLKELGIKQVDVSVVNLSEVKEKALNIALNKIQGEWDFPKLKDILLELDCGELPDIEITGFDLKEIEDLMNQFHVPEEGLTDDDAIPEPTESISRRGDLWSLGNHRLLCGDATVREDVDKLMGGEKADMVFTDPPSNVGLEYASYQDNKSEADYEEFCGEWMALLRQNTVGALFITCGIANLGYWCWNHKPNWVMAWVKMNGQSRTGIGGGPNKWEPVLCFDAKGSKDIDLIEANLVFNDELKGLHVCPKPVLLIEKIAKRYSKLHHIILDLFGGSGTTLIACEKLDRRCFMMEIDENYNDVIIERWKQFTGKDAVRIE